MFMKTLIAFAVMAGSGSSLFQLERSPSDLRTELSVAALKCKKGFVKAKSPVKLGGKVACIDKKAVAAGKKLLTSVTSTCSACHGSLGIAPYTTMKNNIRSMNLTLKAADITTAFRAQEFQMGGVTLTSKDAKNLSAFFQSMK